MAKRREKTLADYVVIAISPVLIMTLVGSLAFFLMELGYRGEYKGRLEWILFWFISASVLVARIAIEQGKEHASVFGLPLIGVVGLAAMRLVDEFLLAWILMGISWWCTWKLTWDCTLIDDSEDASGEGLLQAAGFDPSGKPEGSSLLDADTPQKRPVHPPGQWVVYFSLGALPLFGAGQLLIPAQEMDRRTYAFTLLATYVASALGLLLTTSFLGLRRYLRQRKLQMPASVTRAWLGMGSVIALAILCLALLIPQPQGEYTVTKLVDKLDARLRNASKFALVPGERAQGQGRRIGKEDRNAEKSDNNRNGNQQPGAGKGESRQRQDGQPQRADRESNEGKPDGSGSNKSDGEKEGEADGDKKAEVGMGGANQNQAPQQGRPQRAEQGTARGNGAKPQTPTKGESSASAPPTPPISTALSWLQSLAASVKWLIYAAFAAVLFYLALRHWERLLRVLWQLWAEFLRLLGLGLQAKSAELTRNHPAAEIPVARAFASFDNPFLSGAARRMSPEQLIRYSFEALESWARERVVARPAEQTPLEFAQELERRVPSLAPDVSSTAEFYARVAYARGRPAPQTVAVLERLWRRMDWAPESEESTGISQSACS